MKLLEALEMSHESPILILTVNKYWDLGKDFFTLKEMHYSSKKI